jgi:hypothetical protein
MKRSITTVFKTAGRTAVLAAAVATVVASAASAQVSIPVAGTPVTENFNTLALTGTSSTTPLGWVLAETGTGANATYTAGTGSSTTGDTYSFGSAASTDRAFGGLQSGALIPTIGASFKNDTGIVLGSFDIGYTGEEWRCGAATRVDRIDFQYSLDATSLTTGTWIDVNPLDFTAPYQAAVAALDGNLAANRTVIASNITGLAIAPGGIIWIRWTDLNATGSDDGLSVDDFSITGNEPPVPAHAATWGKIKGNYR